jgi:1-acyl-sn-glycerol-3-phosphate acyltransferase
MSLYGILARPLLIGLVRILVGAMGIWKGCAPSTNQRIYFANHTSHIDTLALWSALPPPLRRTTRPVAARDYWNASPLKRYIAVRVLNAVLIDRQRTDPSFDPLAPLSLALEQGDSMLIFPEGTRGEQRLPAPFKSGLYRLAKQFPQIELVPVYLENLHRSMPKGHYLPVPINCSVWFGAPIRLMPDESKEEFLTRARQAIVEMA